MMNKKAPLRANDRNSGASFRNSWRKYILKMLIPEIYNQFVAQRF